MWLFLAFHPEVEKSEKVENNVSVLTGEGFKHVRVSLYPTPYHTIKNSQSYSSWRNGVKLSGHPLHIHTHTHTHTHASQACTHTHQHQYRKSSSSELTWSCATSRTRRRWTLSSGWSQNASLVLQIYNFAQRKRKRS